MKIDAIREEIVNCEAAIAQGDVSKLESLQGTIKQLVEVILSLPDDQKEPYLELLNQLHEKVSKWHSQFIAQKAEIAGELAAIPKQADANKAYRKTANNG